MLFYFMIPVSSATVRIFYSSFRSLKDRRSSIVSNLAHNLTTSGFNSFIFYLMPSELLSLDYLFYLSRRPPLFSSFKFSFISFKLI